MNTSPEVPVTRGTMTREKWFAELAEVSRRMAERPTPTTAPSPASPAPATMSIFSVYCNSCNATTSDLHFHCSTCDDGDFDLCQSCVDKGVSCDSDEHWLIKRFVQNGQVINSTTEKVPSKPKDKMIATAEEVPEEPAATRTCNSCISEFSEDQFVSCLECLDYDLCLTCHIHMEHGHDPKHAFRPAVGATLDMNAEALLAPGRHMVHNAICDGCDQVRHTCFVSRMIANIVPVHLWCSPQVPRLPRLGLLLRLPPRCQVHAPWSSIRSHLRASRRHSLGVPI